MVFDDPLRVVDGVILVVGIVAHHVDTDFQQALAEVVVEAQVEGEAVHGTAARVEVDIFQRGGVFRIGQRAFDGGGCVTGHDEEVGADTPVVPSVIGYGTVIYVV